MSGPGERIGALHPRSKSYIHPAATLTDRDAKAAYSTFFVIGNSSGKSAQTRAAPLTTHPDTMPAPESNCHSQTSAPASAVLGNSDIFFAAVEKTGMPMIVTDPNQPANPIVFANLAFLQMTGYAIDEVVGNNCRFLQGPETDPATVAEIRQAIMERRDVALEILNYRKDGSTFWNALFISPVFDASGKLMYFFGSQLEVIPAQTHDA